MKILYSTLFLVFFSHAGINEVIKNNSFNLPLTDKNVQSIKVGAVLFIGATSMKGIMDLKRGTGYWHSINNTIRRNSEDKYEEELSKITDSDQQEIFKKRYITNLNRLNRREKFDDAWFGFSRTLMAIAPLGLIAFLYK